MKTESLMKGVACMCHNCTKRRVKLDTQVNIVQGDTKVNLCDIYTVSKTQGGELVMILDPLASPSLAGRP